MSSDRVGRGLPLPGLLTKMFTIMIFLARTTTRRGLSMPQTNVRHLRRVSPPLAGYLRVGYRDAALITRLLEQGLPMGGGVIVDAAAEERTEELRSVAVESGVEVVLDPKSVELSTVGGLASPAVARLPWAHPTPHTPHSLAGEPGERLTQEVATAAVDQRATGVLAPTHFLDLDERWLDVDAQLTADLRDELDANGAGSTAIYYPLVASLRVLRDPATMARVIEHLSHLIARRQVDGVFLRVQGFGATKAGSRNLRSYISVARRLHSLGVPLVGERTGSVGVALAAFGAVGGVESSITHGEVYDARRLTRPPSGGGFVPAPRVYIAAALAMVPKQEAAAILSRRGFSRLACQQVCCRRGRHSMIDDARRHFVVSRANELAGISVTPDADRAEHYLTTTLMPARDNAAQLARFLPGLIAHRNRLDDWYLALRLTLDEDRALEHQSIALVPTGRRLARGA